MSWRWPGSSPGQLRAGVSAVGEDMADPGKPRPHLGEQRRRTVAILDVSLVDHGTEQPPASVHHDMALAAHHLLTRVKPARTSAFRGLHRLAVDHPGSRGSGPPLGLAGARQKRPVGCSN